MPSQRRVASAYFLFAVTATGSLVGCRESVQSPPVVQEAMNLSPEQQLAALTKKAEGGDVDSQSKLGSMYAATAGINDLRKALEWWQKAAEGGDAQAQINLGDMYANGDGVTRDDAKAVEWYMKAAVQGSAIAQENLGLFYRHGLGVPKDGTKSLEWYQKAADQGAAEAQLEVGYAYSVGLGVPKNNVKAAEWYKRAAAQGDEKAQRNLASHYYLGDVVQKDLVLSYAWYNLAIANGAQGVIYNRDQIVAPQLSRKDINEAQRLSSNWSPGQILVREIDSGNIGSVRPDSPKTLSNKGTGTLFVVSTTGHAISNQHVTKGCAELRIQGRAGIAKLIVEDMVNDLALMQIQGPVADTAVIAASPDKLRQGEDIIAFGFPLNAVLSSGGNLTPGVVSALTGLGNNTNQIQITAPIQPGSSGSPVLNKKGEVVGVVSMKIDDGKMARATGQIGQSINFAVSGQTLKTFLDLHKVAYKSGGSFFSREKNAADLADAARKWTFVVECWN